MYSTVMPGFCFSNALRPSSMFCFSSAEPQAILVSLAVCPPAAGAAAAGWLAGFVASAAGLVGSAAGLGASAAGLGASAGLAGALVGVGAGGAPQAARR